MPPWVLDVGLVCTTTVVLVVYQELLERTVLLEELIKAPGKETSNFLYGTVVPSVLEEFLFRLLPLGSTLLLTSNWYTIISVVLVTSLLFGLLHDVSLRAKVLLMVPGSTVLSGVFVYVAYRADNVLVGYAASVLVHFSLNFMEDLRWWWFNSFWKRG